MKKSTLLQRGAAAALALVVPFAAAQGHKNQAFVPGAAAVAAAPASGAAVTVANNSSVATVVAGGDAGIPQTTQEFAVRASDDN